MNHLLIVSYLTFVRLSKKDICWWFGLHETKLTDFSPFSNHRINFRVTTRTLHPLCSKAVKNVALVSIKLAWVQFRVYDVLSGWIWGGTSWMIRSVSDLKKYPDMKQSLICHGPYYQTAQMIGHLSWPFALRLKSMQYKRYSLPLF